MPALLTIQQVATELGCSKQFVYALVKRDVIKHYRLGTGPRGTIRISRTDLDDYLQQSRLGR